MNTLTLEENDLCVEILLNLDDFEQIEEAMNELRAEALHELQEDCLHYIERMNNILARVQHRLAGN
jgi:hypothetical protein